MKSISGNLLLILMVCLVPFSAAFSQNKKTEKKIKVVIDDGSGSKTIIDTTFTNGSMPDSVILKNGKVFYFLESEKGKNDIVIHEGGAEKVIITSTSEDNGENNTEKRIIIKSDDNGTHTKTISSNGEKHVHAYSGTEGKNGKQFDIEVNTSDNDSEAEATKYIIAKDGIVVTIESNDEAKAKELIKEIDNILGVKDEDKENKNGVKSETEKTIKR